MYELNGVKYSFNRVNVEDALEVQDVLTHSSKEGLSIEDTKKLDRKLRDIAIKYLVVYVKDGNKEASVSGMDADYYADQIFDNPFFSNEIVVSFGETIKGFLEVLPSFKKSLEKAKQQSKKSQNTSK